LEVHGDATLGVLATVIFKVEALAILYKQTHTQNNSTTSVELCCTFGDRHSQKGTYNTSFVPLASGTLQNTVQHPLSYIQSTTVSNRSD